MSLHIIITGATGFIGAAIVEELLTRGYQVTVLLRSDSNSQRLSALNGFETLLYTRLMDDNIVSSLKSRKPDILIHCAWRGVGASERNESFQITKNLPLTLDAVELAAAIGCRQWIGLGSQAEYGNQNCRLSEDAPVRPTTLYGKAKLAAGVAALALCEVRNMAGVWLRIFSTYGPGDSPNWFIPYVIHEFLAGKSPKLTQCEQLWDYLYVTDAARAVCAVANGTTNGVFNLGSGSARPLKDYIEVIRKELGIATEPLYGAIPYRDDQVMYLEADISRLSKETGWVPSISLIEGVKNTVRFELVGAN
jgi:UDP-glucose 4-epimerase